MSILIKGDNNGIAVDGNLTIEKLDFVFGKGVQGVSGVRRTQNDDDIEDAVVVACDMTMLPPELDNEEGRRLLDIAIRERWIDENYKRKISLSKLTMVADEIAARLGLGRNWIVFEKLFQENGLRIQYQKAVNSNYYNDFLDQIRRAFR